MREGSGVIRTDSGPAVDKHKGCLLWGARCSPCPLLKQVIFSQTFNTQTSLIWFLSWSQMGIRACKQMNSRAAYLLLAANSKYKGVREKTQELLCPGVSNLFCSSLCVPTAFEGTSPSYLSCRKVCPVSLFDLYLQRCHFFFFCYWSSLPFDKCSLSDWPLMMAQRFPLARDGPKRRTVRGFPHIMLWLPQLLLHQPKPILGRSHDEDAKLWQHTPSSYIPTQASPALPSKLYACSSLPTHSLHPSHSWAQPKFS